MASNWHYMKGDQRCGPISADELRQLITSGQLHPTDLVWKEGLAEWVPASRLDVFPPKIPAVPNSATKPKARRIHLIIAAGIVVACFFMPQFYVRAWTEWKEWWGTVGWSARHLFFGWNHWFGIVSFIVGLVALAGAVVDLSARLRPVVLRITKWVHLGTFLTLATSTLLGSLLLVCLGIGGSVHVRQDKIDEWRPISDCAGHWLVVPIMGVFLVVAAIYGLVVTLLILRKERT